jgi:Melibiase
MSKTGCVLLLAWTSCSFLASASNLATVNASGWDIQADGNRGEIQIRHRILGPLLENSRLGLKGANGTQPFQEWDVVKATENKLTIRTENPRTGWEIQVADNLLTISSTSYAAVITADAPAPNTRIPARTLDRAGVPVIWQGTNEVKSGYDAAMTRNISCLPLANPEVMYFSLGQVSGEQFHSLFDRLTDTAIDFQDGTLLERDGRNADVLRVTLPVSGNAMIRIVPDYYTKRLGLPFYVPFDDSHFKTAPMVWSSWTSYYEAVTEGDIVKNADWLAANLKPYGFQYVQLDDGYDRTTNEPHTWIGKWDEKKFPHGPQWLASHIKERGLRAGLWLVPNAYAGAVESHPDWYVRNTAGKTIADYLTPTLDSTNPEALAFVKDLFTTLDNWGFEYYKFDGEHAFGKYIPSVDRSRLHDPSADLLDNYRLRLKMIRGVLGPDRFIEGCPAGTPLNGIGYFNSYFNGHDLYNNWQGMHPLFSSISSNGFLNHVVVYVMPGEGLELGEPMTVEQASKSRPPVVVATARTREQPMTGFGTTLAEARTLVSYISLTGVAYPLASVMPELPQERVRLLQVTMPTLPILPMDLFSRGNDIEWDTFRHTSADYYIQNYPQLIDLKVNNALGAYDVVAVTNWRSEPLAKNIVFSSMLGLPTAESFIAFDFWNRQLLGTFKHQLAMDVMTHDTRVILLHPNLQRPQVLGTSRHLTGAYSFNNVAWDQATTSLAGTSQGVPGDAYSIWIHVPRGFQPASVAGSARNNVKVAIEQKREGELLTLTFTGVEEQVNWTATFARK